MQTKFFYATDTETHPVIDFILQFWHKQCLYVFQTHRTYPQLEMEVVNLLQQHRLERVRRASGMSRRELAKASGISLSVIYRIEGTPSTHVNVATAERLADSLGVPVKDIFADIEISYVGRPPLTGRPCNLSPKAPADICPGCFLEKPRSGACDCTNMEVRHYAKVG